jgi:hypothetical protein
MHATKYQLYNVAEHKSDSVALYQPENEPIFVKLSLN